MIPWYYVIPTALAVLALVELRLRGMRRLFMDSLIQRESFDASLSTISGRIESTNHRIDLHLEAHAEKDREVERLQGRVAKLEGHRLSPTT